MSVLETETSEPSEPNEPLIPQAPLALNGSTNIKTGADGKSFAYHEVTGRVVALHGPAVQMIELLDGTRTFTEILELFKLDPMDYENPRHQAVTNFVLGLVMAEMIVPDGTGVQDTIESEDDYPGLRVEVEHLGMEIPPGWKARFHLPVKSKEDFILERPPARLLWTVSVVGLVSFAAHIFILMSLGSAIGPDGELPERTVGVYALSAAVVSIQLAFHEAAHGLALRTFGLRVKEVGVRFWFYLLPAAYVAQSGEVFLPSRRQRIIVALAGVISDGFTGFIAWHLLSAYVSEQAALGWAILHIGLLMLNMNPLLPTDGARVVEAALGEVSLRTRATRWVKAVVLRRTPPPGSPTTLGKKLYGVASVLLIALFGVMFLVQLVGAIVGLI